MISTDHTTAQSSYMQRSLPRYMSLRLYNSLTNTKEDFVPLEDDTVRIYSCGQTIYEDMHVGNAKTYAAWDILNRYLTWKGYRVFHVMNVTDVGHLTDDADEGEDKVVKAAREKKLEPMELVTRQVRRWYREMDALNMKIHNINPRATGHMVEMIEAVQSIMDNGYGYERNGTVYFDVVKFKEDHDYPKLGGRILDDLKAGAGGRVSDTELSEKKSPYDFALWIKAEPEHLMKWPSPWGKGYPGWHLECSVMAAKYLGEQFDIHTGGVDHIFPHHPNERAQNMAMSCAGDEPVKYWVHSAHITVNGEKMSKSKGNFYTVEELLENYDPAVIRMFFAGIHYRSQSDFSLESLEESKKRLERFQNTLHIVDSCTGGDMDSLKDDMIWIREEFEAAMDDDMNTPLAMSKLLEFSGKINKSPDDKKKSLDDAAELLKELLGVLGIPLEPAAEGVVDGGEYIDLLLDIREELRKKKDFDTADHIRDELTKRDIVVEDTPEGARWRTK